MNVSLSRIVFALLFCLMLALMAALLLRRGGGRLDLAAIGAFARTRPQRRIEVIETRRISQHADVCLLSCDGTDYLILSSSSAQQVLRSAPRPSNEAGPL